MLRLNMGIKIKRERTKDSVGPQHVVEECLCPVISGSGTISTDGHLVCCLLPSIVKDAVMKSWKQ